MGNNRKVLMVLNKFDIGGAETHVSDLSLELKSRGYDIVIASAGGVYVPALERSGIRHIQMPLDKRSMRSMWNAKRLLRKAIREERPDVVHAHARIPGFLCGQLSRSMGFPFVTTFHGVYSVNPLLKRMTACGQRALAVSEDVKTYLMESYGVPADHIRVTINGINTDRFCPAPASAEDRAACGLSPSAPVLCSVSRLDAACSLAAYRLIELAPALTQAVPGVQILLVGSGEVFEDLSQKAEAMNRQLGYPCVVMTGPRTDIDRVLRTCDVFVGVSRAALEAMAEEKPVVLAGSQGFIGILDQASLAAAQSTNLCCRGCAAIDSDRLREDILTLFRNPARRQELGRFGRQLVLSDYSVRRMADDCEAIYDQVLPR